MNTPHHDHLPTTRKATGLSRPANTALLMPLIAALAMSLSSASVIGNALRLRGKDLRAD